MSRRLPLPTYRVTIERHACERWIIPAQTFRLVAYTEPEARLAGIRECHIRQSLPPWRPLVRESWPYSSATRTDYAPEIVPDYGQQLEIAA